MGGGTVRVPPSDEVGVSSVLMQPQPGQLGSGCFFFTKFFYFSDLLIELCRTISTIPESDNLAQRKRHDLDRKSSKQRSNSPQPHSTVRVGLDCNRATLLVTG